MREIEFRGIGPLGRMVYGNLVFERDGQQKKAYILDTQGKRTDVDPDTVGQYIGKEDKTGKRVFEGDLLLCEDDPYPYLVVYNDKWSIFEMESLFNKEHVSLSKEDTQRICHITGNKWETPWLLERKGPLYRLSNQKREVY